MTNTNEIVVKDILRVLIWNANGILTQAKELEDIFKTYSIDIALINETNLHPEKIYTSTDTQVIGQIGPKAREQTLTDTLHDLQEIEMKEQADAVLQLLTTTVQEAYRVNTNKTSIQHDLRQPDPDLDFLIVQKREARRDWQTYRAPQHRMAYNRLRAQVRRRVRDIRLHSWNTNKSVTAIHGERGMVYKSPEMAEAIAESLEKQFKTNDEPQKHDFTRDVARTVRDFLETPNDTRAEDWLSNWRIKVNPTKSAAVILAKGRKTLPAPLTLFDTEIPLQDEVKYLGITIDKKLTWRSHVDKTNSKSMDDLDWKNCQDGYSVSGNSRTASARLSKSAERKTAPATLGGKTIDLEGSR
uniref:Reverse transcriptase n=1 Tax=Timema shepardi TaxID=629360 RepID=A0A7R9B4H4_TIMSH|nr:unnamed protein product [Timema shepardi]